MPSLQEYCKEVGAPNMNTARKISAVICGLGAIMQREYPILPAREIQIFRTDRDGFSFPKKEKDWVLPPRKNNYKAKRRKS